MRCLLVLAVVLLAVGPAVAGPRYSVNDRVMIRYGTEWMPASVTGVRGDVVFRVRYDGAGGEWNTIRSYIRPESGAWKGGPEPFVGERVSSQYLGTWYGGTVVEKRPGWIYKVRVDGVPTEFETLSDYMYLHGKSWWNAGDAVMVLWNGTWYKAWIVRAAGPDSFLIHYDGYGKEHDEVVTAERIRPIGILD